jgi:hypothetical protein
VYVVGTTEGTVTADSLAKRQDAFVRRYDMDGQEVWTRQFGVLGWASAGDIAVTNDGDVVVVGSTGALVQSGVTMGSTPTPSFVGTGPAQSFIRRYDAGGSEVWTRQIDALAHHVRTDREGYLYVVGQTPGRLEDNDATGQGDVFVGRYSALGEEAWTLKFGTPGVDLAGGVALSADGTLSIGGSTTGTFPGQTSSGNFDAFIATLTPAAAAPVRLPRDSSGDLMSHQ